MDTLFILLFGSCFLNVFFAVVFWGLAMYYIPPKRKVIAIQLILQLLMIAFVAWNPESMADLLQLSTVGIMLIYVYLGIGQLYHFALLYVYFLMRYVPKIDSYE